MKLRTDLEFYTTLPDDIVEKDGDIVQFPGLSVTEALGELMTARGYVVSELYSMDFLGWEIILEGHGHAAWMRIARNEDDCMLFTKPVKSMLWPFARNAPYEQFLRDLHETMNGDARFNRMTWVTRDSRGNTKDSGPTPFRD